MLELRYGIRISESYVDPNPLMVEIQDPDNFTRFQTRERCALEIAAYVFKENHLFRHGVPSQKKHHTPKTICKYDQEMPQSQHFLCFKS